MLKVKPFYLLRVVDINGISGTGVVAIGVVLPSGSAILEWCSFESSINIYKNLDHVKDIHGHEGKTTIIMGHPPSEKKLNGKR